MMSPAVGQRGRIAAVCLLLIALVGLLVWGGTVSPTPPTYDYPGNAAVISSPDAHVGERVTLSGTVVATDPPVVRVTDGDDAIDITLRGADAVYATGDRVLVVGTLRDDSTLTVIQVTNRDRVANHERWEYWYLYGVSLLGGLWVFFRVITEWRVDRTTMTVMPRTSPADSDGESDA